MYSHQTSSKKDQIQRMGVISRSPGMQIPNTSVTSSSFSALGTTQHSNSSRQSRGSSGRSQQQPLQTKISTWLSSIHTLELSSTLNSAFLLCLIEIVVFLQQFVFLEDSSVFRIRIFRQIHAVAKDYIALTLLIHAYRSWLVWGYFLLCTLKLLLLVLSLHHYHQEGNGASASQSAIKALAFWHKVEFSIGWIPLSILVCSSILVAETGVDALAGFGIILLLGIQSMIVRMLNPEFCMPNCKLESYGNYLSEVTRPALDLALVLVETILSRQSDMSPTTRFSVMSILLILSRLTVLFLIVFRSWYPYSSVLRFTVATTQIVLLIFAAYELAYLAAPATKQHIEIELASIVVYFFLAQIFLNLNDSRLKWLQRLEYQEQPSVHSAEVKTNYMLGLYSSAIEEGVANHELTHLFSTHIERCKNVNCLCRVLRVQFKTECFPQFREKKELELYWRERMGISSLLEKLVFMDNKDSVDRTLLDQEVLDERVDDIVTAETLKIQLKKLENEKRNVAALTKSIHKRFSSKGRAKQVSVVDGNSNHFKAVVFGFLVHFAEKNKSLDAIFLAFRFCMDQLQNYTLILLRGYNLKHSSKFQTRSSLVEKVSLSNYLWKAQSAFNLQSSDSEFWVSEVKLNQVLKDTDTIDYCSDLLTSICDLHHSLLARIQKKQSLHTVVPLGNQLFEKSKEFNLLTKKLLAEVLGSRKLLMLVINYKLNVSQESRGIKNLIERYQRFSSKRKNSFGLENLQKKQNMNFFDPNNIVMMHSIKSSGIGVTYFTRNAPGLLNYSPEKLEGMNAKELLPGKLRVSHDEYIVDFLNGRKKDTLAPFAISGFMVDGKNNALMANNLVKVEVIGFDHIYIASSTSLIQTKKTNGLVLLDDDFSLLGLSQGLKLTLPELDRSPGKIFYRAPLMIELARNCLGLHKLNRERSIKNSEIAALRSQEFLEEMPKEVKPPGSSTPMIRISPIFGGQASVPPAANMGSENNLNLRELLRVDGSSLQNIQSSIRRNEPSSPMFGGEDQLRSQFKPHSLVSDNPKSKVDGQGVDLKTLQNDLKLELELKEMQTANLHNDRLNSEYFRATFEAFFLEVGKPKLQQQQSATKQASHSKTKVIRVNVRGRDSPSKEQGLGDSRQPQDAVEEDLGINTGDNTKFVDGLQSRWLTFLEGCRRELQEHPTSLKECSLTLTYCRYKEDLGFYGIEIKNLRPLEHKGCRFLSKELIPASSIASLSSVLMVEVSMFKAFCRW